AFLQTRARFDIEGRERETFDAADRLMTRSDFDMNGVSIHQAEMDSGERWVLKDVTGKPVRAWDSRLHSQRTTYDALRRQSDVCLRDADGPEQLVGRTVYGEDEPDAAVNNLRTRAVRVFDQAGRVDQTRFDFKGTLLQTSRRFAIDYKRTLDWTVDVALEPEI